MHATDFTGPGKLIVGNGNHLSISKSGNSVLHTSSCAILINVLLHVPAITKNLLSVSKLARDNNIYFEFHATTCLVRDEDTGVVLLQGAVNEGLYQFNSVLPISFVANKCEANVVSRHLNTYNLWHMRLGHPAHSSLAQVSKKSNIVITGNRNEDSSDICVACRLGKSHKMPSADSNTEYTEPFALVYTDL
ncbi:hypothetical protein HRI_002180700 [Hibiscus trionum]|uniref:GAG-pre-integrase domain-containing protein n=1 Tax=Hibiscus trionum TaxID=183268 RepID=A0A9W7M1Z9_HIBTR|nr:hypothetical protein HRI_002180700 [Hibiscus trionum]